MLAALVLASLAFAEPAPAPAEEAPPTFDQHTFVLLRKGPNWTAEPTEQNRQLQKAHLAHLSSMAQSGRMLVAGPFSDQEDDSLRGLCIYRVPPDEARTLAEQDPRVVAGHLRVEVMTLWTEAGALAFPRAVPLPE